MKLKLDENFGTRIQNIFRATDHDVDTVYHESLSGATDADLYQVCQDEERCLVTLDLDFANVMRFSPQQTSGIAVIRMPRNPSLSILEQLVHKLLSALEIMSIIGKLWIVELDRIRVHQTEDSN